MIKHETFMALINSMREQRREELNRAITEYEACISRSAKKAQTTTA